MHITLSAVAPTLDPERPRYLMGVGTPADLVRAIGAGIDVFDCVLPTRNARNGQAFVPRGRIVIKNARYRGDSEPLDPACSCPACENRFSRSYLRHLYLSDEMLAHRLLTLHNLWFYGRLMADARRAVELGQYASWAAARLSELEPDELVE